MLKPTHAIPSWLESFPLLLVRLAAGALFLWSAWNKLFPAGQFGYGPLPGMHYFAQAMRQFNLLPEAYTPLAVYAVPWMEVVVGVCLVLGFWTRAAGLLGIGLLATFTGAVAWTVWYQKAGVPIECGCFGRFKLFCEGVTWCKVGENIALIALFTIPARRGGGRLALTPEYVKV